MVSSATFERFLDKVLEPLPGEVLVDTAYNSLLRDMRGGEWRRAMRQLNFLEAQRAFIDAFSWAGLVDNLPTGAAPSSILSQIPSREETWDAMKRKIVALLTLPAPDQKAVAWKRQQLKRFPYLPMDEAEARRAIESDEAFLAAHPTRRPARH